MKRAGIKVWVLTGDKVGTAKMIGLSTGLLEPAMVQHEIREGEADKLGEQLRKIRSECEALAKKNAESGDGPERKTQGIIVAGSSLASIDADEELRKTFLAASDKVDVVLACRVSPK